jgi:phosphatidate cytidylyltransferase
MRELSKRVLLAIFGIPVLVILTYLGGWYFFILILIISLVAQWEFYQIQKNKNIFAQKYMGLFTGLLILIGIQVENYFFTGLASLLCLLLILLLEMFRKYKNASIHIGITLLGILYIPVLLSFLLYLRNYLDYKFISMNNTGFAFILTIMVTIWICDTFAYFYGKKFGKHKLFLKVSPNKSVEGAIAGLLGSLLVFIIVYYSNLLPYSLPELLTLGSAIGIGGQLGDLVESWFKRDAGVKDSSTLLPGHGGMLDRFDSLIFISPVVFIFICFIFN